MTGQLWALSSARSGKTKVSRGWFPWCVVWGRWKEIEKGEQTVGRLYSRLLTLPISKKKNGGKNKETALEFFLFLFSFVLPPSFLTFYSSCLGVERRSSSTLALLPFSSSSSFHSLLLPPLFHQPWMTWHVLSEHAHHPSDRIVVPPIVQCRSNGIHTDNETTWTRRDIPTVIRLTVPLTGRWCALVLLPEPLLMLV